MLLTLRNRCGNISSEDALCRRFGADLRQNLAMKMKKYLNVYAVIGAISCSVMLFISWGLSSRVFEYLIKNTRTELGGSQAELVISWGFSYCMINGSAIMQLVLPLLAVLFSFSFIRLCGGYYGNAKPRVKRFSRLVCSDILRVSLTAAAALYLGFLIFWLFGASFHPVVIDENYSRSFLNDIFGEGFSWNCPLAYFALEGVYKYAIFPFVYCAFACTAYLFLRKKYMSVIVPAGYYTAVSVIAGTLAEPLYGTFAGAILKSLRPSNMLMMGAESSNVPAWSPLISLIPPIFASIAFFIKGMQNEKKSG